MTRFAPVITATVLLALTHWGCGKTSRKTRDPAPTDTMAATPPPKTAATKSRSVKKTPAPAGELEVRIRARNIILPGTLSVPKGPAGRHPGILLVHGSGPQNRDEEISQGGYTFRPFKELAAALVKEGYVVLRYDKRAFLARSKVKALMAKKDKAGIKALLAQMGQDTFIADARAALDFLKARSEVDPTAIFVVGHSIAGLYASALDAHMPLKGMILLAPEILPFREHLVHQATLQLGLVEKADKEKQGSLLYKTVIKPQIDKQRKTYKTLLETYDKTFKALDAKKIPAGANVLGMRLEDFHRVEALSSDLPHAYAALKTPVLYVNGKNDWICPVDAVERFRKTITSKKDLELVIFEDLSHVMYKLSPVEFSGELVTRITGWLGRLTGRKASPAPMTTKG